MYKKMLAWLFIMGAIFLTGCENQAMPYSTSADNLNTLNYLYKQSNGIDLADFSDPKHTISIMCRLNRGESLPDGQEFVAYIKHALRLELEHAKLYAPESNIKLDARLEAIDFNSFASGGSINNGKWTITMVFDDHHQMPYTISSAYVFHAGFIAFDPCKKVAKSFVPAVQKFLMTVYNDKNFRRTLQLQGK